MILKACPNVILYSLPATNLEIRKWLAVTIVDEKDDDSYFYEAAGL